MGYLQSNIFGNPYYLRHLYANPFCALCENPLRLCGEKTGNLLVKIRAKRVQKIFFSKTTIRIKKITTFAPLEFKGKF